MSCWASLTSMTPYRLSRRAASLRPDRRVQNIAKLTRSPNLTSVGAIQGLGVIQDASKTGQPRQFTTQLARDETPCYSLRVIQVSTLYALAT